MTRLTSEVAESLKSYVYVYIDPRDGQPFYIGKGKGDRFFVHLDEKNETQKTSRIAEIRKSGNEPRIDVLRYGLSDSEASLVEAAAIDLVGKSQLTNQVTGFHRTSFGRITTKDLISTLTAKPANLNHKAILITINKLFRSDMSPLELYEATRGVWVVGKRKEKVEFAMAVYQGIVREVYRIGTWHRAGTLKYETRDSTKFKKRNRWEFEGTIAEDIRNEYIGLSVGKGGQNPIRYSLC